MTRRQQNGNQSGPIARAARAGRNEKPRFAAFLTLAISAMLGGLLVLASQTQVPQITRAPGAIVPFGDSPQIETLQGGVVKSVHVVNGQTVEAGDLLVELTHPDLMKERDVLEARLRSLGHDLDNAKTILSFLTREALPTLQDILYVEGRGLSAASSRLRLFAESQRIQMVAISQQENTLEILAHASEIARKRAEKKQETLGRFEQLHKQGLKTLSDYLREEDAVDAAQVAASNATVRLAEASSALAQARSSLAEERLALQDETIVLISELEQQQKQLQITHRIISEKLSDLQVLAPARGIVQAISYPNPGEVVAPGEAIFELLPTRQALIVEARIPNSEIGHVSANNPVTVSIDTYDVRRFGKVGGELTSIYPLPLVDEQTGETYFRASFELDESSVGNGAFQRPLQAGMTVVAEMKTGEQSLLSYLLKPVQVTMDQAFNER